jgi:hypothetical protein
MMVIGGDMDYFNSQLSMSDHLPDATLEPPSSHNDGHCLAGNLLKQILQLILF